MPMSERSEYMKWVTGNARAFIPNQNTLVACVYCRNVYGANYLPQVYNCLVCSKCGIDAVMIHKDSPLHGLKEQEQKELLDKWHAQFL